MRLNSEKGFVLPLALLLMVLLTLSGTSFLQLGFLEQRMTAIEINNQSAFYLANAGIEREREAMKISDTLSWTTLLQDTSQRDPSPPCLTSDPTVCLCPTPTSSRGCVIPPFGKTVSSPDLLAFEGTFDHGQYQVRAFNNVSDPGQNQEGEHTGENQDGAGTTDTDQILTFRAIGTVNGQQKLLEVTAKAVSGLNLLDCKTGSCPNTTGNSHPTIDALPGHEPVAGSTPNVPTPDFNYYGTPGNFPFAPNYSTSIPPGGPQSNTYYYISSGDVNISGNANNVVIFVKNGKLTVGGTLTNAILVSEKKDVSLNANNLSAPAPTSSLSYPVVIAGANLTIKMSSQNSSVSGNIYAAGDINLNPYKNGEGVIIGNTISTTGSSSSFSDGGNSNYYNLMPGFTYPPELKTTVTVSNSWSEVA